jgi:subtilisin-like proprotein convertase family protein
MASQAKQKRRQNLDEFSVDAEERDAVMDRVRRGGGSEDNLVVTYKSTATPALAALRGQSVQGAWKLRVADLEAVDMGKLNRWAMKIVG